ncbi:hypothetical protein ANANG_G00271820 [Anguilla anguilla]|uniref:Uncharacterized protein n=1 Tax=Anguilla anguilla TaxID=7936 RepID=A0A9D3RM39_ANGAN|nr:hypothetical protein ANANG_G00271820 [Anguilla anguilla]
MPCLHCVRPSVSLVIGLHLSVFPSLWRTCSRYGTTARPGVPKSSVLLRCSFSHVLSPDQPAGPRQNEQAESGPESWEEELAGGIAPHWGGWKELGTG